MTRRVASYIILTADGMPELGPNASVLEGAVVDLVRAMRAGDGPPIGLGAGADLFATLNDQLRALVDPGEMQYEAAHALSEHLQAARVGFAETQTDGETVVVTRDHTDGVPDIEGRYRDDDFSPTLLSELRSGRLVVYNDVAGEPTLTDAEKAAYAARGIGATANAPLARDGRLVAVLFVHYREAHVFSPDEVVLLEVRHAAALAARARPRLLRSR